MARLYLDHNVTRHVEPHLRSAGHDFIHSREVGSSAHPDDALLLSSVQLDRIFVTHNRKDFRMLHDAWVTWPAAFGVAFPEHPGILTLDQAPVEVLAHVLTDFLDVMSSEQLVNTIFWWHRHDGWRQPIAGAKWAPHQPPRDPDEE